jgi:hypothetical protein
MTIYDSRIGHRNDESTMIAASTLNTWPTPSVRVLRITFCSLIAATIVGGCTRATGTWRTVSTEPPGLPFPLHELTLDESGAYRATSEIEGKTIRSAGAYRWDGRWLRVQQEGYEPRAYRVTRRRDGSLVMAYEINGRKLSAVMQPSEPQAAPPPPAANQRLTPPSPNPDE